MTKKEIINQINLAAAMGTGGLKYMLRAYKSGSNHIIDMERAEATAYNQCAGNLAKQIGIASFIWDKPAALAKAA